MKNLFLITLFSICFLYSQKPISLIVKKRGVVKIKNSTEGSKFSRVNINTPLLDGSIIKTNKKSFVKIKYMDAKSLIMSFPKTQFSIEADLMEKIYNKKIVLLDGILKIDVNSNNDNFKLITSFSELSCHNCSFWIISDKKGDSFYNIKGNAVVTNLMNMEELSLVADSTLISFNSIGLKNTITSIEEKTYLESLLINFDEISKEDGMYLGDEVKNNILEIRLKNSKNIKRKFFLNYSEQKSEK